MQLVIDNTLTGKRRSVELTEDTALIGRPGGDDEPDPEVPIRSPLISRQQAMLKRVDDQWTLEHMGFNETRLGDLTLERGKIYKVEPSDEIRIAEFVITLVDDSVFTVSPELSRRENELMEFESEIHDSLLERMDLRRGESQADPDSAETRERIEEHLDQLLGSAIDNASSSLLDHILKDYVQRKLTWLITASGTERGARRRGDAPPAAQAFEQMLSDVLERMGRECELSFDCKRMYEDSQILDEKFDDVFERNRLEFSEGLRRYIVHSAVRQDILDVIFGLGPLQDLMEMESVSEVMVVARDQIFIEKFGVIEDARRMFFSDELLMNVIERIVSPIGRRIDKSSPLVDAHLPDGSRVNAIIPPLAVKGPCITIRKFAATPLQMSDLLTFNALSEQMSKFLKACVECEMNVLVSGGTGSGKTTFLNCLSAYVDRKQRIVTIEDTAELQLKQSHTVTLEARPANMEGKGAITIRDLVKNALRMRPDRIIVGECRGAETLDMLQAMNTGHDGSMTTAHANSPEDMMLRLETMVLSGTDMPVAAIREQIVAAVDVVAQLNRFSDGSRRVTHISEITSIDEETGTVIVEDVFRYQPPADGEGEGKYIHTGYIPTFIEKLLVKRAVNLEDFF